MVGLSNTTWYDRDKETPEHMFLMMRINGVEYEHRLDKPSKRGLPPGWEIDYEALEKHRKYDREAKKEEIK